MFSNFCKLFSFRFKILLRLAHDWVQQTEYRTKYLLFYWLHSPTTRYFALKFYVNFSHPGCF